MDDNSNAVEDILDEVDASARQRDEVSLDDIVGALDHRGFAPFLVVLPLLELSPFGGIPGVPTLLAALIALFGVQIALGREELWLPGLLRRRKVSAGSLLQASQTMRPVARWLDRWFHGRLRWMTRKSVLRLAGAVVVLLCLTVPPLELVPFASSAPMAAVALIGVAMLFHDGAVMLVALAVSAAALLTPLLVLL